MTSELILARLCDMYLAVVGRVRCSSCNELGPEVAVLEDPIVAQLAILGYHTRLIHLSNVSWKYLSFWYLGVKS